VVKRLFLAAAALLVSTSAFAQPARPATPPDISGEWRLENDEEAGALGALGQPPLGDYLGIPSTTRAACARTRAPNRSGARRSISAVRIRHRISGAVSAARAFSRNRIR
jgi:hypothetical protein